MGKSKSYSLRKKLPFIATTIIISIAHSSIQSIVVQGQNLPSPPLPQRQQPSTPERLSPLPEILPSPDVSNPSFVLPPEGIPGTILIKRFEIVGNTVFDPEEITRLTEPYTLRQISFIELQEVTRKISQLYRENGYITSGAVILPQIIEDRVVKVQILEGKLEDIEILGLKRLNPDYVRRRLEIATQAPLNQNRLLNALQVLQFDPLIANISAELSAGIEPGTSSLQVEVTEADTFSVTLNLDNNRVPSVGTFRRGIAVNHNNLLGQGDRFNVSYVNTDGSDTLDNLSYEIPINARNGKIRIAHGRGDSTIIQEPFDSLDIRNKTRRYEISYTQPIIQSLNQEAIVGIRFSQETSRTRFLDDEPFPNTGNAINEDGETKVNVLQLFQNFVSRDQKQVIALRSQFNFGLDILDSTIDEVQAGSRRSTLDSELADSRFVSWQGQAQYLRLLSPQTTLYIRSQLQLANDSLVSLQKFSLGGALSVRGYSQNALVGDNGLFISTEILNNIATIENQEITFELIPFVDFGKVWNTKTSLPESVNTLLSMGIGFQVSLGNNLTGRIDWGIPLIEFSSLGDSLQENGVYFSIQTQL
ncbi:MAG: ShlB/FhaC/HecB family hemolysin secretion/activation protein [Xenococcaceae cyanobacterium MO_167.B27]|nr:ShlB/FhaC/HecB family hemolysin secretion/activation protein [Xenococcaceae cyanobacterium MO_167.B27]